MHTSLPVAEDLSRVFRPSAPRHAPAHGPHHNYQVGKRRRQPPPGCACLGKPGRSPSTGAGEPVIAAGGPWPGFRIHSSIGWRGSATERVICAPTAPSSDLVLPLATPARSLLAQPGGPSSGTAPVPGHTWCSDWQSSAETRLRRRQSCSYLAKIVAHGHRRIPKRSPRHELCSHRWCGCRP